MSIVKEIRVAEKAAAVIENWTGGFMSDAEAMQMFKDIAIDEYTEEVLRLGIEKHAADIRGMYAGGSAA